MNKHAREYFIIEVATILGTVVPIEIVNIAVNQHLALPAWAVATLMLVNTVAPPLIKAWRSLVELEATKPE